MKLNKVVIANALALTTAIWWVACYVAVTVFPGLGNLVMRLWIHSFDLSSVAARQNLTLANFVVGGATFVISAWLTGYVFGWSWEKMSKK